MASESWLPIGFQLPDLARCGRVLHAGEDWQIFALIDGGAALVVREARHQRWLDTALIKHSDMAPFSFGAARLFAANSSSDQALAPTMLCRSPSSKVEALAFAMALRATREAAPLAPLHDAIYFQKMGRLLPVRDGGTSLDDDLVLGQWLTGGAHVSVNARRQLGHLMGWLSPRSLDEVITASAINLRAIVDTTENQQIANEDASACGDLATNQSEDSRGRGFDSGVAFSLPGRPELEHFFNEHVVDVVRHKERYAALGVGFPSAIALHGPPGCGKTHAVEQLVAYLGWPGFQIDASSVASPYIHETSKKVAEIFDKALKSAPSVLVIDEMEAYLADRESGGGSSSHRVEEVAEFLRRIPEASKNQVLVVGITNRIEMIDPAIMRRGRFDHVLSVDPATTEEVEALLIKLLSAVPCESNVDCAVLARRLTDRPLSDVAFVVREGARLTARAGGERIEYRFLLEALDSTPPRVEARSSRRIGFT